MINHQLLETEGILILRPEAPLESADFQRVAQEIDPYIEANGKLHGVMIDAESFPGWKDFAAMVAHLKSGGTGSGQCRASGYVRASHFSTGSLPIAIRTSSPFRPPTSCSRRRTRSCKSCFESI